MRRVREGEVPRDGGTAVQEDPDGRRSAATYPTTTWRRVRQRARASMHAQQMTLKVRVRCGRCRTVNVADTDIKGSPIRIG